LYNASRGPSATDEPPAAIYGITILRLSLLLSEICPYLNPDVLLIGVCTQNAMTLLSVRRKTAYWKARRSLFLRLGIHSHRLYTAGHTGCRRPTR